MCVFRVCFAIDEQEEVNMMEKIAAAAMQKGALIVSLPRPNRHGDIIKCIVTDLSMEDAHDFDQGFITSEGRYVDRREGAAIAIAAGQITELQCPPNLFSEDLW